MRPFLRPLVGCLIGTLLCVGSGVRAADFDYTWVEVSADGSRTKNTSAGAIGDADGTSFGFRGSLSISDAWYLTGGYLKESKSFRNDVVGTKLNLSTDQTFLDFGAGYHWKLADRTDLYAEAFILDSKVRHDLPVVSVRPSTQGGPPTQAVSKRVGTLDGRGPAAAFGMRHWASDELELEARMGAFHVTHRNGRTVRETQKGISVAARYHLSDALAAGVIFSFTRSNDPNFNNISKVGISLRFHPFKSSGS